MTDEQIAELRGLLEKAGLPWAVGNCEKTAGSSYHDGLYYRYEGGDWNIIPTGVAGPVATAAGPNNASLIVAAINALPDLLASAGRERGFEIEIASLERTIEVLKERASASAEREVRYREGLEDAQRDLGIVGGMVTRRQYSASRKVAYDGQDRARALLAEHADGGEG